MNALILYTHTHSINLIGKKRVVKTYYSKNFINFLKVDFYLAKQFYCFK